MSGSTSEPRITAPVSRLLGARDLERTVDFWRDVLGFEVGEPDRDGAIEVTSGPARIHFGRLDSAPDFSKETSPGSAIVFFDTDHVETLHAAIILSGGSQGQVEKVERFRVWV